MAAESFVQVDAAEVAELERRFRVVAPQRVQRGLRSAFFALTRASLTESGKIIRQRYTVKAARLRRDLRIVNPNPSTLSYVIRGKDVPIGIGSFVGTRQNRRGVRVKIRKDRGPSTLRNSFGPKLGRNTFFTTHPDGEPNPKVRMSKGFNQGRLKRQLDVLFGPSAADMMLGADIDEKMADFALARYETEVNRQIDRAIRGF